VNNSLNYEDYGYLNHDLFNKKSDGIFRVIYSGRLTKAKKVDILIKALGILKLKNLFDFRCYIIGDGELDQIKKLSADENVLENIDFIGPKYGQDVHMYFLNSDLYIYPGGIGLSVLHAMSFGLPVITTNNLHLHFPEFELLVPGYTGDLFTDNCPEDLALKIVEWRDILGSSQEVYINNCIRQIKELEYLPDIMISKVLSFLKSRLP
jgi:glycosyltransferase involved in cell wall biosynthesis